MRGAPVGSASPNPFVMDNTRVQGTDPTNGWRLKPKKFFCVDAKEQGKNPFATGVITSKTLFTS